MNRRNFIGRIAAGVAAAIAAPVAFARAKTKPPECPTIDGRFESAGLCVCHVDDEPWPCDWTYSGQLGRGLSQRQDARILSLLNRSA